MFKIVMYFCVGLCCLGIVASLVQGWMLVLFGEGDGGDSDEPEFNDEDEDQ